MGYKEDLTSNPVRVDNVLDTIACLNTFPFKQNVNDAIVEGLASDYGTEYCTPFNKPNVSCVDIKSILKETYHIVSRLERTGEATIKSSSPVTRAAMVPEVGKGEPTAEVHDGTVMVSQGAPMVAVTLIRVDV